MKAPIQARFHGSYRPEDVTFLLKPITVEPIGIAEKERLIQSGKKHYSEMLSPERPPSPAYLSIFRRAQAANRERLARDLLELAAIVADRRPGEIVLVSLARAGTPIGVILKHLLTRLLKRECMHYSISIIRDRGIDANALRHILEIEGHSPESLVFVDGWTGKGVIARELNKAVAEFNQTLGTGIDPSLYVLSDLAGVAGAAASCEDYLIPSGILNATVSGLISRSVLNESVGPDDFHGCVHYREFAALDISVEYAEDLLRAASDLYARGHRPRGVPADARAARETSRNFLRAFMARHGVSDENLVKPGLGEATRVLLRRAPERVVLRDAAAPEVAHLLQLAAEKNVAREIDPHLPYLAVSLIQGQHDV
jgi:hypothetical protein